MAQLLFSESSSHHNSTAHPVSSAHHIPSGHPVSTVHHASPVLSDPPSRSFFSAPLNHPHSFLPAVNNPHVPSYYEEAFFLGNSTADSVILDTGATAHMFCKKEFLVELFDAPPSAIKVASEAGTIFAAQRGTAVVADLTFRNVLFSPDLTANLISASQLYDEGYNIVWKPSYADVISPDGSNILQFDCGRGVNRLWQLSLRSASHTFLTQIEGRKIAADLWHRRLGHLHPAGVIKFLSQIGQTSLRLDDFPLCDACRMGKAVRSPTTASFHRLLSLLACVHSDLLGPFSPESLGGKKDIMYFIDDYSRYSSVYLLRNKSDAFKAFLHYQKWI